MNFKFMITSILIGATAVYAGVLGYIYTQQGSIIFPADKLNVVDDEKIYASNPTEVDLTTADATTIRGLQYGAPESANTPLVLLFGGNAHNPLGFAEFVNREVTLGDATVVSFLYRGYSANGIASDSTPSQEALTSDALTIYDAYAARYQGRPIHVIGYSLGSSIATYLASQRKVGSLILVTPFTSMADMAGQRYPYLPAKSLTRHPLPTIEWLHHVNAPTTLIFAGNDGLIPDSMRSPLIHATPNLRSSTVLAGETHGDILWNEKIPALFRTGMGLE